MWGELDSSGKLLFPFPQHSRTPVPAAVVCQFTFKKLFYLVRAYNSKYCVRLQQRGSLKGVPLASFLILLVGPVLGITNKSNKTPHLLHHKIYNTEAGSLAIFLLVRTPPLFPPLAQKRLQAPNALPTPAPLINGGGCSRVQRLEGHPFSVWVSFEGIGNLSAQTLNLLCYSFWEAGKDKRNSQQTHRVRKWLCQQIIMNSDCLYSGPAPAR